MTMASSAKQERIRWLQEDLCQIDESIIRRYIPMQRLKEEFLRRAMPGTLWSSSRQGFNLRTRHKHPPPPPSCAPNLRMTQCAGSLGGHDTVCWKPGGA